MTPCGVVDFDLHGARTELVVTASDANEATAVATMRRVRKAIHEEVWAQLFVDDVFVDVVRTAEIDTPAFAGGPDNGNPSETEPCFVARFVMPPLYVDGELHRARVCFVARLSRSTPRLDVEESGVVTVEQGPEATTETDFRATRAAKALRAGR